MQLLFRVVAHEGRKCGPETGRKGVAGKGGAGETHSADLARSAGWFFGKNGCAMSVISQTFHCREYGSLDPSQGKSARKREFLRNGLAGLSRSNERGRKDAQKKPDLLLEIGLPPLKSPFEGLDRWCGCLCEGKWCGPS